MAGNLRQYDFKKVSFVFGGQVGSGYAKEGGISFAFDEDGFDDEVGADGEGTRSTNNNEAGTFKLKLKASSAFNDVLTGFFLADKAAPGAGILPGMLKDGSGRTLLLAEKAWIKKLPDIDKGKKNEDVEWMIRSLSVTAFIGGN